MKKKKIVVLGLGRSGRSACSFLLGQGKEVIGIDQNLSPLLSLPEVIDLEKQGLILLEEREVQEISAWNQMILSPGISPSHPLVVQAKRAGVEVIGEAELGARYCHNPAVGVTGTNGKTTVTLLTTHVLTQVGKKATALGNVGEGLAAPLTRMEEREIGVVELSSFQLETLVSPFLDRAVLLNITPDHLDRYESLEAYARAKCLIQKCLKRGGELYLSERVMAEFAFLLDETRARTFSQFLEEIEDRPFLDLFYSQRGSHDRENLLAAYSLCSFFGVKGSQFAVAAQSFQKPPHRIEFVAKIREVAFYDDSKATNIDAVIQAVQSFSAPIHLIVGGVDKGFPYTSWRGVFEGKVKGIFAIGASAPKIQSDLSGFLVELMDSLEGAVRRAYRGAKKGEIVLLSPGCSSYDMFRNYEHRGEEFKRVVRTLAMKEVY